MNIGTYVLCLSGIETKQHYAHVIVAHMHMYMYLMVILWSYPDVNHHRHLTWYNIELNTTTQYIHIQTCYIPKLEVGISFQPSMKIITL